MKLMNKIFEFVVNAQRLTLASSKHKSKERWTDYSNALSIVYKFI